MDALFGQMNSLRVKYFIFCKVLLNRIEPVLDGVLREEQAGFRKGRGCNDQIFVVRHLMQQANEMKAS